VPHLPLQQNLQLWKACQEMRSHLWISWRVSCHGCAWRGASLVLIAAHDVFVCGDNGNGNGATAMINRSINCNGAGQRSINGTGGGGTGAGATVAMGQRRSIIAIAIDRSCGCGGPWGQACANDGFIPCFIRNVSECQLDVRIKE
jgi:hypothetical protein